MIETATHTEFLALHGLAVRKSGPASAVADLLDADEAAVAAALESLAERGMAIGANGLYMVTPAGRDWLISRYEEVFAEFRTNPEATESYDRFERVNRELLRLFTGWQMVPAGGESVPNDHSDPDYDSAIVDRLGALHERAHRPLEQFAEIEPRLGAYLRRLGSAYDRVLVGGHEFVSGVKVDSYHTVWFELHEDLLRALGREREEQA